MRFSQTPPNLLSLLLVLLTPVSAGPYPKDDLHDVGFSFLVDRACVSYCGAQNQYCCTEGQGCYTTSNIAFCSAGANVAAGATGYALYTTTWTETDLVTRTSTVSSWYQPANTDTYVAPVATGAPPLCTTSLGESSCGGICCASNQKCAYANSCTPYSGSIFNPTATSFSPPLRPTSGGLSTSTAIVSATTTAPFLPPATASGSAFPLTPTSSGGLSAGAIAGIVIGVLAAIIILILICFCCIVKAGFDGILAIFGLGKKKHRSRETIITEERYSRHGSRHGSHSGTGSRREHTGWYGGRPAKVEEKKKKSGGIGGLGMVGAGLLGMAAILGLKKREEKKERRTTVTGGRSDISSSYYTDSYTGTSASSASSDRRTRDSRHHGSSRR